MPNNVAQNEEEQNQQNPEEELNHQNSNGDEENEAMEDGVSSEVNEGNCCPICMHPWSSEGAHRICCLPCGHVYGLSCAEKWLQKSSGNGKCPQCNRKCSVKNILRLYASHIPVSNEHKEVVFFLSA
ncbi:hypothetical protein GIB67_017983 [Kingdonia uniflora]|uniref:RING-type domain-containing protein n=1 Tax=Kingdonia uniflora TaxID=39325 RepID=A0A7J7NWD2_9MAGN|nr:hypothetical protein GIB67_017983 [Kingdonia uniflora]